MFGGFQSSDEFNPFAFLNQHVNGLQARRVNIHLVFEGPGGGGLGHEFDFGLPSNPRDYFVVPRLEQLIQLPRTIPIGSGGQETGTNDNQFPRTTEKRFRISLPWIFRGLDSPAETSNSGGGPGSNQ
ncbi:E3 ubiquitin- ligase RING1-like [Olea europaea subsp. europaea]|uniref:E3 ubiquitin- ligase RING1-like n=1 Tax=Olea europaea subsp. europaea TaxID=158383 RepID=A0A8S0R2M6_OLEEU|nr:E3 ubiquitin- ligase RING1-like [Olea europaea subsp. europaea]